MTNIAILKNVPFSELSYDEIMSIDGGKVDWDEVGLTITTASTGVIGAYAGGKIGAAIGTVAAPGIGTAVGAIVGAAVGAIIYTLWD